MKTKFAATALILASGLIASTGFAADSGALSREQVRATVLQARADGSLALASAEIGNASSAAVKSTLTALTRERVMAGGESNLKLNELYPSRYPAKAVQPSVTREKVKAELAEARVCSRVTGAALPLTISERQKNPATRAGFQGNRKQSLRFAARLSRRSPVCASEPRQRPQLALRCVCVC